MPIRDFLGRIIGLLEMIGFRYPVKHYMSKVTNELVRGSRLKKEDYRKLRLMGVDTIVNLCAENDADAKPAFEMGIKSVRIPIIDNTAPTSKQMDQFIRTVKFSRRTYVHCEAGKGRTGVAVACYRKAYGMSSEEAIREAKSFGLCLKCQEDFIKSYNYKDSVLLCRILL